ncbi:MAG: hypothetical protein ACTSU3_05810 [Candidatus Thorarchaeota archaeon]
MSPDRYWILVIAAIACVALTIAGGFMYPLNAQGIFEIIIFEIAVLIVIFGLFRLIYARGLPDEAVKARKSAQID